jgi:glycine/D-amino acid oxidase-like deaminating enzyme
MRVCVIGAGVIGCATAYELARQGHDVHLLDSEQARRNCSPQAHCRQSQRG